MFDTQYLVPDKFKTNFKDFSKNSFSALHLNIRSINKNFEAFTEFYSKLNLIFSVACFSASEENIKKLNFSTKTFIKWFIKSEIRSKEEGYVYLFRVTLL